MPWITWYQEDWDSAPTGKVIGYDDWQYAGVVQRPNNSIESGVVSPTHAVSGYALSCETQRVGVFGIALYRITGIGGLHGYYGDGTPASGGGTMLYEPRGICLDGVGNIYFADSQNQRIRKVDTAGIITTFAGTGPVGVNQGGYNGDGIAATGARLNFPCDVRCDSSGNIYIADAGNHRIRKVDTGGIITTIAGNGFPAYIADGVMATGASGSLYYPRSVCVDASGNIYIADGSNSRVRKVDTGGVITTLAGTGIQGFSGDGGAATGAQITQAWGIDIGPTGDIFIGDTYNRRVRRIRGGIIDTVYLSPSTSHVIYGISVDQQNNVYFANGFNGIHRINNLTNVINNIAGPPDSDGFATPGSTTGFGGLATNARINRPTGLFVGPTGTVYISDTNNHQIEKVEYGPIAGGPTQYEYFVRPLSAFHENYDVRLTAQYFAPLPVTGTMSSNTVTVRGLRGNSLEQDWNLQFDPCRDRLLLQPMNGVDAAVLTGIDFVTTPQTIRIVQDAEGFMSIYIPGNSASAKWVSTIGKTGLQRGIDRLGIILSGGGVGGPTAFLKMAIDDIEARYFAEPTAFTPVAPRNVFVNSRADYSILSWDATTRGIATEDVVRNAGYTDNVANTNLATSPKILSAIIDATTVKKESDLPKEGQDFNVDRGGGVITWRSGANIIKPDTGTTYRLSYEMPIVPTKYNVYKSKLLNEYDRTLCKAVTGLDFNGVLDTAFIDTAPDEIAVYRVASVNSLMVESELSEKVVAIKVATQADAKTEVIDRKLFTLDESLLDEEIIR